MAKLRRYDRRVDIFIDVIPPRMYLWNDWEIISASRASLPFVLQHRFFLFTTPQ